jgi:hypothetical protein
MRTNKQLIFVNCRRLSNVFPICSSTLRTAATAPRRFSYSLNLKRYTALQSNTVCFKLRAHRRFQVTDNDDFFCREYIAGKTTDMGKEVLLEGQIKRYIILGNASRAPGEIEDDAHLSQACKCRRMIPFVLIRADGSPHTAILRVPSCKAPGTSRRRRCVCYRLVKHETEFSCQNSLSDRLLSSESA